MSISDNPHILVYPFQTSGHIIPLLDLTHRLLNRGLVITVIVTPNNLPLLHPFLSSSQFHHLVLPSPQIPPDSKNRLVAMMRFMRHHHYPALLSFFQSHSSPPVAIISDFFIGWTHELASQIGIPRIVFSPSAAFAFSITCSTWRHHFTQIDDPENPDDVLVEFPSIPNSPSYRLWQISHIYKASRDSDWEFFKDCFMANLSSWGIVFNSFAELEGIYLHHLKKDFPNDNVWAVGPVLPLTDDVVGSTNRGGSSSHDVLTWLDSRKEDSVVYVCFGSRAWLTCKQMAELVTSLEKSKVSFILCDRQPNDGSDDVGVVPDGFKDRVGERGYVIKGWAPQVAILRHRAVGAFLTHCGWNSVLEGISAGVVMLTWPMGADQYTNTQLLVDQLGVGIRVGESTKKIPDSSDLARILDGSVKGSLEERKKAKKLQEAAGNAIIKGGSSDQDLDGLIVRLYQLKLKNLSNYPLQEQH
ncbi:flavonol 3-O-glucosyltransferase UGT89B1-like [Euphorbia lathyris]|uniref:flavonol 3-O-glucosyltransferase UGT89B1-like n=1 Tax=Euphorbia lathyris TaxID=212925 RepID=UPI003313E8FA